MCLQYISQFVTGWAFAHFSSGQCCRTERASASYNMEHGLGGFLSEFARPVFLVRANLVFVGIHYEYMTSEASPIYIPLLPFTALRSTPSLGSPGGQALRAHAPFQFMTALPPEALHVIAVYYQSGLPMTKSELRVVYSLCFRTCPYYQ